LESEREDVRASVRGEFTSALESLSNERAHLLGEVSRLRRALTEAESSASAIRSESRESADKQVEAIHNRVKVALEHKDQIINELRAAKESLVERLQHLEEALDRKTKEKLLLKV